MLIKLLNLIILLICPFIMAGIIKKVKSFWGGRRGPSILQPLFDFIKLIKKDFVISKTTSSVFKIAPVVAFLSVIFASVFVPIGTKSAIINVEAGLILFAYTLSLGKFVSLISAMDTGSSFEGMGASREACFSTMVEPAFFMTLASIMAAVKITSFESLHNVLNNLGNYGILIIIFSVAVLLIMILVECSRIPVDDPATHLELTMIHEVMVLDNSGLDLALYGYANGIKMLLFSSLIANLIIPSNLSSCYYLLSYLAVLTVISVLIGTIESSMARIRMSHIFEFIFIMSSFALIVLSLSVSKMFGG